MTLAVAFNNTAANVATVVYTFTAKKGQPNSQAYIASLIAMNVSGAARTFNARIVASGGTITQDRYCIIPKNFPLAADEGVILEERTPDNPTFLLVDGDQVVLNADAASGVAVRLIIGTRP